MNESSKFYPGSVIFNNLTKKSLWSSMMSLTLMKYRGSYIRMQHSSPGLDVAVKCVHTHDESWFIVMLVTFLYRRLKVGDNFW